MCVTCGCGGHAALIGGKAMRRDPRERGGAAKVAVLSVTEGEDKPLKYPDMFRATELLLLNKCDLLPHLDFDVARAEEYARRVNPSIEIIRLSATSGAGMANWLDWLERRCGMQG